MHPSNKSIHPHDTSRQGIGQALKTSGKTAAFCNNQTGLIPQLFVTSPHRITVESAFLSFPYYTPDSIYGTEWVYRNDCHDLNVNVNVNANTTSSVSGSGSGSGSVTDQSESIGSLEQLFPGIDDSAVHDREPEPDTDCDSDTDDVSSDHNAFLAWLGARPEKIIAISSTPSWIESFCNDTAGRNTGAGGPLEHGSDLRAVGIKFYGA
jgi:hypothetical protein